MLPVPTRVGYSFSIFNCKTKQCW